MNGRSTRTTGNVRGHSVLQTVVLNAASNVALPLSALVTAPLLARILGPVGRGELASVASPITFMATFLTLGIPEGITFLVASDQWSRRRGLITGVVCAALAGVAGAIVLFFAAPVLLVHSPQDVPLLRGLAVLLPLLLAGLAVRGTLHGAGDFLAINMERWTSVASRLVLLVAAAMLGLVTVASAAWISNLTAVAAIGMLFVAGRGQLFGASAHAGPVATRRARRSHRPGVGPLFRYGSRVWLGTLSTIIILRADQVMMTPLVPAAELGFYAVSVAVTEIPAAGFTALRDVLFFRSSADGDDESVARAIRVTLLLSVPLVALAVLVAPIGVRVVFGAAFAPATSMTQIMLLGTIPAGLATMMGAALMGRGHPGRVSVVQAVAAIASVALLLVLVPIWGGEGAALASLIAYLVLCVAMAWMFVRNTSLRIRDLVIPQSEDLSEITSRLGLHRPARNQPGHPL